MPGCGRTQWYSAGEMGDRAVLLVLGVEDERSCLARGGAEARKHKLPRQLHHAAGAAFRGLSNCFDGFHRLVLDPQ